jgi:HD-GYP domain-containing protein (c-di-GMP phosphodiesterase class II)
MFIASQKRKENIAEYLIYMWQIEDIIRANNLDIEKIKENVIDRFSLDDAQRREMTEWYESLIDMMRREDVVKSGHLQINKNVIVQLVQLHRALLADPRFAEYSAEFYRTLPFIVELRAKAGENPAGEIETCFNALYGMLMMRLQSKEVTPETANAIAQISRFIALLAHYFKLDDEDRLFNPDNNESDKGTVEH